MAKLIKAKPVSGPLEERFKAESWYESSSGSEHDGVDTSSSSCLSDLVNGFFDPDEPAVLDDANEFNNDEDDCCDVSRASLMVETLRDLLNPYKESCCAFRLIRLCSQIITASEELAWLQSTSGFGYRRAVMARLRELGHNAGICKAKWEASSGLTAGSYEYIDIVVSESKSRYIVDVDFAAQFEIARATDEYQTLVSVIPTVVIVRAEVLRQVVRIMDEAMRRSLKSMDLRVPPWRKSRYMIAKWLGPYRRTVNPLPSSAGTAVDGGGEAKCRMIGFMAGTAATVLFR